MNGWYFLIKKNTHMIYVKKIKNQEEKDMKKEMMIETVENTYDIVGAARTINN